MNFYMQEYSPVSMSACSDQQQNRSNGVTFKRRWTVEEDIRLYELIQYYGTDEWRLIANSMNNRSSKQCRERWKTKFNPEFLKGDWTDEEDTVILAMHEEIGNKWTLIAKALVRRTESDVRNRFSALEHARRKNAEKVKTVIPSDGENGSTSEANDKTSQESRKENKETDIRNTIASTLANIHKKHKRNVEEDFVSNKKLQAADNIRKLYIKGLAQQQVQQSIVSTYPYLSTPATNGYMYPNAMHPNFMYPNVTTGPMMPTLPQTADGMVPASAYMQLMQQTQFQHQVIGQLQQKSYLI